MFEMLFNSYKTYTVKKGGEPGSEPAITGSEVLNGFPERDCIKFILPLGIKKAG